MTLHKIFLIPIALLLSTQYSWGAARGLADESRIGESLSGELVNVRQNHRHLSPAQLGQTALFEVAKQHRGKSFFGFDYTKSSGQKNLSDASRLRNAPTSFPWTTRPTQREQAVGLLKTVINTPFLEHLPAAEVFPIVTVADENLARFMRGDVETIVAPSVRESITQKAARDASWLDLTNTRGQVIFAKTPFIDCKTLVPCLLKEYDYRGSTSTYIDQHKVYLTYATAWTVLNSQPGKKSIDTLLLEIRSCIPGIETAFNAIETYFKGIIAKTDEKEINTQIQAFTQAWRFSELRNLPRSRPSPSIPAKLASPPDTKWAFSHHTPHPTHTAISDATGWEDPSDLDSNADDILQRVLIESRATAHAHRQTAGARLTAFDADNDPLASPAAQKMLLAQYQPHHENKRGSTLPVHDQDNESDLITNAGKMLRKRYGDNYPSLHEIQLFLNSKYPPEQVVHIMKTLFPTEDEAEEDDDDDQIPAPEKKEAPAKKAEPTPIPATILSTGATSKPMGAESVSALSSQSVRAPTPTPVPALVQAEPEFVTYLRECHRLQNNPHALSNFLPTKPFLHSLYNKLMRDVSLGIKTSYIQQLIEAFRVK